MILFAATGLSEREASEYPAALRRALPQTQIATLAEPYEPDAIAYAITWRPPHGLLAGLPRLKGIVNLGAGVDALLADTALPDVPLVRFVDPDLTLRMGEWVTLQVLTHHRRALELAAAQRERHWIELPTPAAGDVRIGIMGFGNLGAHCAACLRALGFAVHAYARAPRPAVVPLYWGDELPEFLARTDVLVVLLPLTAETRGIVDAALLAQLPQTEHGPILINAGRGRLHVEPDVVAALADGTLKGASLDVFEVEPLPDGSPLWRAPNVVVSPHCAAVSAPEALASFVARTLLALETGDAVEGLVARDRGY